MTWLWLSLGAWCGVLLLHLADKSRTDKFTLDLLRDSVQAAAWMAVGWWLVVPLAQTDLVPENWRFWARAAVVSLQEVPPFAFLLALLLGPTFAVLGGLLLERLTLYGKRKIKGWAPMPDDTPVHPMRRKTDRPSRRWP